LLVFAIFKFRPKRNGKECSVSSGAGKLEKLLIPNQTNFHRFCGIFVPQNAAFMNNLRELDIDKTKKEASPRNETL
jgi:hypothetical protein